MSKSLVTSWRRSFLAGLAITLPAIISILAVVWLLKTVAGMTDVLLFFLPKNWTHAENGTGDLLWYWSPIVMVLSLVVATTFIMLVGFVTRYYIGRRMLRVADELMLNVPLLNKFYGAIKQINQAFTGSKNSFKTVVLVEFPGPGNYSVAFITNEVQGEIRNKSGQELVSVFIPTTPNPTSGFLILVPVEKVTKLDMSVADGIKYIVSLGAISPEATPPLPQPGQLHD